MSTPSWLATPVRDGRGLALASLALAMVTVGTIAPASKVIAEGLPPFLAGALRLAIAAAALVPWAAARHPGALAERLDAHDRALLALQAAAGTVGFTVLMLLGTARTSAADASVVTGALPAVAALLSAVLLRERPGLRRTLGVVLAAGAVAVVACGGAAGGAGRPRRLSGDLLVLGAVISESLFILLQKRLHRPPPALVQSALMSVLGLLWLLPAAIVEACALDLGAVPPGAWWAVGYYALVPTVLGFVLWYRGAERVSGAEAGIFTALTPLAGAATSALVLGEPLGGQHAAALVLVVAAIALAAGPVGRSGPGRGGGGGRGTRSWHGRCHPVQRRAQALFSSVRPSRRARSCYVRSREGSMPSPERGMTS